MKFCKAMNELFSSCEDKVAISEEFILHTEEGEGKGTYAIFKGGDGPTVLIYDNDSITSSEYFIESSYIDSRNSCKNIKYLS